MQTSNQEDVIEIDLQDLFGLLLHKAWIIILATLATAVIGFAVSFFLITPQYESTTSIYISTSKGNENSMTYSDAQLASQLTKDYEELILGRTVLEKVITQYQLKESYESLKKRVSVENTTNTRIISITVKDPNPENAQIIANSIRDVAATHIKDVTDVEAVNVADEANLPEKPCEPSVPKWIVIAALIGMLLSAAVIVVQYLLDDTIKSSEDIEKYLEENGFEIIEARMTDVIRKTYFYQDSQIREYHLNKPIDQKIWFRTADMFFDLAHSLTDSIAKGHPLYKPAIRMDDLVKDSDPIIHHTFDAGEGVLIPGEIIHHAKHGCKYFLILQPFGCLPNHVVGRGISKKLKEMYPNAQILPLDYDPDVSFANIENRLQMLVMNAKQEILEENEERDRRRSHHYMESDKKTYRRKKYGVEKTSGV